MGRCQLCSTDGATFRALPYGVPLPDGRRASLLCDRCDDELALWWLAVDTGEVPALKLPGVH